MVDPRSEAILGPKRNACRGWITFLHHFWRLCWIHNVRSTCSVSLQTWSFRMQQIGTSTAGQRSR